MAGKADEKTSRCWPGFEPVPGKGEHEQGSCRPKAKSKNGGKPVDRERSRKKAVAEGGERGRQAKTKSPSATERRSASKPASKKSAKTSGKGAAAKKAASKKSASKKTAAKKTPAKKTAGKKPATKKSATQRSATKRTAAKKAA